MYNILLTDDEQIVIESLSFIINKNFDEEVKIHTALSGTKALEIVTRENIDIIFMDINMPGLMGLETVSCITKIKPEAIIIILSAFDKFQYAQEAMNLGVYKYITKPVNRNVVVQTIQSAMDTVDARRGLKKEDKELQKKLDMFSPMIENDFIYACAFNYENDLDLTTYLDYFNIPDSAWCFCCFEFPNINSENKNLMYKKIRDLINEKQKCLTSSFIMNRIIVYYPVFSAEVNYIELIKDLYKNLCFNISNGIKAGISSIYNDKTKLTESYSEALSNLNRTPSQGGLTFSGSTANSNTFPEQNEQDFKKQILLKLKQGDTTGVKSYLDLFSSQIGTSMSDINVTKNKFFEIIVSAYNVTTEILLDYTNQDYLNAFATLSAENSINSIRTFTQKLLLEFASEINHIKTQEENPIISKVAAFIQENLDKDISLEQMADYVNISSFYLSKLFKEEKGISFITYLTDCRLEKAQELLQQKDYSIKEITAMTGYNDQNYFSRLFKNKFGISPSEYRNSL